MEFVSEVTSLLIAQRESRAKNPELGLLSGIGPSKDLSLFNVPFEDLAAVIGILLAKTGVFLGRYFQNSFFDGAASVLMGLLQALVALVLARESKGLLIGELGRKLF